MADVTSNIDDHVADVVERLLQCDSSREFETVLREASHVGITPQQLLQFCRAAAAEAAAAGRPSRAKLLTSVADEIEREAGNAPTWTAPLAGSPIAAVIEALAAPTTRAAMRRLRAARSELTRGNSADIHEVFIRSPELAMRSRDRLTAIRRRAALRGNGLIAGKASLLLAEHAVRRGDFPAAAGADAMALGCALLSRNRLFRIEAMGHSARADYLDGRYLQAAETLEDALDRSAGLDLDAARWALRLELAQSYLALGRAAEAVEQAQLTIDGARTVPLPGYCTRSSIALGEGLIALGRYDEAETALADASDWLGGFTGSGSSADAHNIAAMRGGITAGRIRAACRRGDLRFAKTLAADALGAAAALQRAEGWNELGTACLEHLDLDGASHAFSVALAATGLDASPPYAKPQGDSLFGLGDVALLRGEADAAERIYEVAIATVAMTDMNRAMLMGLVRGVPGIGDVDGVEIWLEHMTGGGPDMEPQLVRALAARHIGRGELAGAIDVFRAALERSAGDGPTPRSLRLQLEIARLQSRDPDGVEPAIATLEESLSVVVAAVEGASLDERRAEIVAEWQALFALQVRLLLDRAEAVAPRGGELIDRAANVHETAKSRSLLAGLSALPIPVPESVPAELMAREAGLLDIYSSIQREPERSPFHVRRLAEVRTDLRECWAEMSPHAPAYVRLRQGRPGIAEVRERLREADLPMAVVSFYLDDRETTCFVIRPDERQVRVVRMNVSRDALTAAVAALRRAFNGDPPGLFASLPISAAHPDRTNPRLASFYEVGVELLSFLPYVADLRAVCVAPHGPLHGLPFAAMRMSDGAHLAERHAVTSCPSLSILAHLLEARPRAEAPATAYLAGVAAREDERPELFEANRELLADTPWELTVDENASAVTPERVQWALTMHDTALISCHGYVDPLGGADSGLLLSDGIDRPSRMSKPDSRFLLSAGQLLQARSKARLVTLRACSTGIEAERNRGDEFVGLTRGLLLAGTPSALVTLWNVDVNSSRQFLQCFYRHWRADDSAPLWEVLWSAQRDFLCHSDPALRHPYHWAPFNLIGDPR